jgi:hypothetical protein
MRDCYGAGLLCLIELDLDHGDGTELSQPGRQPLQDRRWRRASSGLRELEDAEPDQHKELPDRPEHLQLGLAGGLLNQWAPFVVAALTIAGCSNDSAVDTSDPYGWVAADIRGTLTQSDRTRLDKVVFDAEQAVIGRCMELAGFDYSPVGYTGANSGSAFSLTDPADAAKYGFGISTDPFPALTIVDDPNADALGTMSESEASAWYSTVDECAAGSRDTAYEQLGVVELMSVLGDASEITATDDRVKRASIEWSACAADLGVVAESLDAVVAKLSEEARSRPPEDLASAQDRERRLATDLLPCTQALYAVQQSVFADVATSLAADRGLDVDAEAG